MVDFIILITLCILLTLFTITFVKYLREVGKEGRDLITIVTVVCIIMSISSKIIPDLIQMIYTHTKGMCVVEYIRKNDPGDSMIVLNKISNSLPCIFQITALGLNLYKWIAKVQSLRACQCSIE